MKVELLLDGRVINTQIISTEPMATKPSLDRVKRLALQAALEDNAIRISESLRLSFRLFDVGGQPIQE